ncbi:MAG: hypothetical protein LUM44_12595 [Pyrinomonadaceae bacterium]|nr:hypothetical protein [Pyrinomonadaceae bacterium]
MKVKTSGFALDFQDVTIYDFLRYLKKEVSYTKEDRILVVDQIENADMLWGGYLLHLKEERIFPQVKLTEDEIETVLHRITDKNVYHGDFNFFLINTITRKGLFQSHSKTSGWTYFAKYLGHRFNNFKKDTNNRQAWLVTSALFRQGSFEEYLEKFDRINKVTIETSHYEVQAPHYRKLNEEASRRVEQFLFYKRDKWNLKKIKNSISSIFYEEQPENLRIEGNIGDIETAYTTANDVEVFYEQDFEEWMKNLKFNDKSRNKSVNSSQSIKELIRIYKETLPITGLDQSDKVII